MLVIRLKPTGKKKRMSFRIVVMEKRSKMEGRAKADLGFYNPYANPAELSIDREKMDQWIANGAQLSTGVKRLLEPEKTN